MSILNYINIPVFIARKAIGIIYVYVYKPDKLKNYI